MKKLVISAVAGGALLGVSGCMTYPYHDSFAACDNAAGQCYRGCEDYEGTPDYGLCHDDCDYSANQCFNSAYEPYRYSSYSYGYSSPWSGRYGHWYPGTGYVFSFNYFDGYGYSSRRHRYYDRRGDRYDRHRDRRYDGRRGRYDDDGGRRRRDREGDRSGQGWTPPQAGTTPQQPSGTQTQTPRQPRTQPRRQPRTPPPTTTQPGTQQPAAQPPATQPRSRPPRQTTPRRTTPRDEPDRDLD